MHHGYLRVQLKSGRMRILTGCVYIEGSRGKLVLNDFAHYRITLKCKHLARSCTRTLTMNLKAGIDIFCKQKVERMSLFSQSTQAVCNVLPLS